MNPDWEMVFSSSFLPQAELVKALLEHNEIVCVLRNNQDSSYKAFGEVEVYVKREDVIQAKYILDHNELE
jgi:hypothetical protein